MQCGGRMELACVVVLFEMGNHSVKKNNYY